MVGLSVILSLKNIMSSDNLHLKKNLGIKIRQYFQVHEHEDPSNSKAPYTKDSFCLGPIGNEQGRFGYISLN